MKKFIIDEEVLEILPEIQIGVMVVEMPNESINLGEKELKEIEEMLKNANNEAKKYLTNENFSENEVIKIWRDTYQKFPTKKRARCSIENLLKRILKDNPVGSILPTIDIPNIISLKYALPIGAEDLDKFEGDLHLGVMQGDEEFYLIGSEEVDLPLKGEIAYADNKGCVCRSLNWRDGERTKIDDTTKKEFIAIECMDSKRGQDLKEALDLLETLLKNYLNVEVRKKQILDINNREVIID
ncbi:MAG: phenylalanine--tRNA ligase beta subunit-related protein [Ruminococcus sp.]|nr:phenylalanine--tRNA ligase beta subunit-related protein [Ruminococcus sp.]